MPAAFAAVLDRDRSLFLESGEGTEERRVSRLVADESDDILLVEHLRELGKNVAEVVEESAGRVRWLGGRGLLLLARNGHGRGFVPLHGEPPEPFERTDPCFVGRVDQGEVPLQLLLERAPALFVFLLGHRRLLPQGYGAEGLAVEREPAVAVPEKLLV